METINWQDIATQLRFHQVDADEAAKVDEEYLERLIWKLKVSALPEDYKAFLMATGGSCMADADLEFVAGPHESVTHVFYGKDPKGGYDLIEIFDNYNRRVPASLLPIGEDPGQNLICLGVKGDDLGKVYYWDHEAENGADSRENLHLIASSFTDFISSVKVTFDD